MPYSVSEQTSSAAIAAPHEAFSSKYRYYVLALLTLGYVFNFVDRQVMTILIEPIKTEFGATDTQMGLLSGWHSRCFMQRSEYPWRASRIDGLVEMSLLSQ